MFKSNQHWERFGAQHVSNLKHLHPKPQKRLYTSRKVRRIEDQNKGPLNRWACRARSLNMRQYKKISRRTRPGRCPEGDLCSQLPSTREIVRVRTFALAASDELGQYRTITTIGRSIKHWGYPFEGKAKIGLLRARKYEFEGTTGSFCKTQVPILFLFETGAGLNHISSSIVLSSWRSCIQRLNFLLLGTVSRKSIKGECIVLHSVHIGELEVRVWFGAVNELAVDILVWSFFHKTLCARYLPFFTKNNPQQPKPIYNGALGGKNEKETKSVAAEDKLTVMESSI